MVIQPLWVKRADITGKARFYTCLITSGVAVCLALYYICGYFWLWNFWRFLIAIALLSFFSTSLSPMVDAIVIRNTAVEGFNFAHIRLGGTIGYAVVVLIIGNYIQKIPSLAFILASMAYFILLFLLTRLPDREDQLPIIERDNSSESRKKFFPNICISDIFTDKNIYYVLLFAFLFQLGASFSFSFLSVFVCDIGYGQSAIGLLNFVSAASEIPVLLIIRKLKCRFGLLHIIAFASILMGVRILIASFGTMTAFIISQCLQGPTYMIIHYGSATFIQEHVHEGKDSEGQGTLYFVQSGVAAILGNLVGGKIIDKMGFHDAYSAVGIIVGGISVILTIVLLINEKTKRKLCSSL
jgi:MFS family permease